MKDFQLIRNEGIDSIKSTTKDGMDEIYIILNAIPDEIWLTAFNDRWSSRNSGKCQLKIQDNYIIVESDHKNVDENLDVVQVCIALANVKYTVLYEDAEKQEELEEKLRDRE